MKNLLLMIATAWGAMILEQSHPGILPVDSLLLPLVIVGVLWSQSAGGLFAGGVILVVDWVVRPQGLPLLPVVLTLCTTMILCRSSDDLWTGKRAGRSWIPDWMQPMVLVIVGVGLLTGPTMIVQQTGLVESLHVIRAYAMVSLPLSLLLTGLMKLAGEFGLRQLT